MLLFSSSMKVRILYRIMSRPSAGQTWLLLKVTLILKVKTIGFHIFYLNKLNIILYSIDIVKII